MTSHSTSPSSSSTRTFLAVALLAVLVMITRAMSGTWEAAIPALVVWGFLAGAYGAYLVAQGWHPVRPRI